MRNQVGLMIPKVRVEQSVDAAEETADPRDQGRELELLKVFFTIGDDELRVESAYR
jgi:hypothetical protein